MFAHRQAKGEIALELLHAGRLEVGQVELDVVVEEDLALLLLEGAAVVKVVAPVHANAPGRLSACRLCAAARWQVHWLGGRPGETVQGTHVKAFLASSCSLALRTASRFFIFSTLTGSAMISASFSALTSYSCRLLVRHNV